MTAVQTERNRRARQLFAPLAGTYDRYASLLSFGQDPRWRRTLVAGIGAGPEDRVLDVATGTAAVAIELVRRYRCSVTGVDQSAEMLDEARRRIGRAGMSERIQLVESRAEALPFDERTFDHLTFTYLLRYVDDPAATLRELVRVVQPGGRIASLEFFVPRPAVTRALWDLYVDIGLPTLGRAVSPGWREVGRFLGPSIRDFYARYPLEEILQLWRAAGIRHPQARPLTLGGGIVIQGVRGD